MTSHGLSVVKNMEYQVTSATLCIFTFETEFVYHDQSDIIWQALVQNVVVYSSLLQN
jgi:hypothetical protein